MKLLFVSLGCDKNRSDSEVMLGILGEAGYIMTDDETEADVIIVNTCCFIGDAQAESVNTILELLEYRKTGSCKAFIVTGCLAERFKNEIKDELPEIDAILGTGSYDRILEAVETALGGSSLTCWNELDRMPDNSKRALTTGGHYAYLKIAEGCNKCCTYCVIPGVRGHYRSYPMEELVTQAEKLAEKGVRELILVAQETTLYGKDLYGYKALPELLRKLCRIPELHWIRLLYCYPEEITPELIDVMKTEDKICHYLDMPIQHANDRVLKRMGRRTNREDLERIIRLLRQEIPDIALRTTLISGFPGETEEQHEELMDFVDLAEFDRLGVFAYSREEGTPAGAFPDQIPEEIKEKRRDDIMELQQDISLDISQGLVGKTLEVMIEGKVVDENAYVGRTYRDAPDVDGYLFVNTDLDLVSGDFVMVTVTGAMDYDLIGEVKLDEFYQ